MDIRTLINQTEQLRVLNQDTEKQFHLYQDTKEMPSFEKIIKPFAEHVSALLDKWYPEVVTFIKQYETKYLHVEQIDQMKEHMEVISVKAFVPETKEKQFKEQVKSIEYTLSVVLEELNRHVQD